MGSKKTYERAVPLMPNSLAAQRFKRDFTSLNAYYWGATSSMAAVNGVVRHLSDADDFRKKLSLMHSRFDRPLIYSTSQFREDLNTSENWHRRSSLIMLLSAFERYMATVTRIAVASDPALSPGFPKIIDGLSLFKYEIHLADHDLVGVVKGEWGKRIAAYSKLFGPNQDLETNLSALEVMRNNRNKIAHQFASSDLYGDLSSHAALMISASRVTPSHSPVGFSEKTLLEWFALIDDTVKSIDAQMMSDFIGNYEMAAVYLEWEKDPSKFEKSVNLTVAHKSDTRERQAKRMLTQVLQTTRFSVDYVRSMIAYTNGL